LDRRYPSFVVCFFFLTIFFGKISVVHSIDAVVFACRYFYRAFGGILHHAHVCGGNVRDAQVCGLLRRGGLHEHVLDRSYDGGVPRCPVEGEEDCCSDPSCQDPSQLAPKGASDLAQAIIQKPKLALVDDGD